MKFTQSHIPDVVISEPQRFEDGRGWFMESLNEQKFHDGLSRLGLPIPRPFVQDNHSKSKNHVLRGLHYQIAPHSQGKLVRVTQGAAYDVAVDIREGSVTFGKWVGVRRDVHRNKMLWIPEGFAHGFLALEDNTHFHYKTTGYWVQKCERTINWNDPELAIEWPYFESAIANAKDSDGSSFRWVCEEIRLNDRR